MATYVEGSYLRALNETGHLLKFSKVRRRDITRIIDYGAYRIRIIGGCYYDKFHTFYYGKTCEFISASSTVEIKKNRYVINLPGGHRIKNSYMNFIGVFPSGSLYMTYYHYKHDDNPGCLHLAVPLENFIHEDNRIYLGNRKVILSMKPNIIQDLLYNHGYGYALLTLKDNKVIDVSYCGENYIYKYRSQDF